MRFRPLGLLALAFFTAAASQRLSAQAGPRFVRTGVPNGTRDLPPGELDLTFTFDARVADSVIWEREGALLYPTLLQSSWSADRRTLTLHVRLAPGREYGIHFRPGDQSYRVRTAPAE